MNDKLNRLQFDILTYLEESKNAVSQREFNALEPYRVKRAVFIAAGFGSRLVPVTLNTPKPLVRVNGKRIIDTLIDAVLAAGIHEIIIVRGYLAEQFDQLLYKYPMIKFIENPIYNESNNISSAMCVCYLLGGAYVFKYTYEMPGGKERYWDQVPLVDFGKEYQVEIRECNESDIVEIDTFRELKMLDKTYDV